MNTAPCSICRIVAYAPDDHDAEFHAAWAAQDSAVTRIIVRTKVAASEWDDTGTALLYLTDVAGNTAVMGIRPNAMLRLAAQLLTQFLSDAGVGN